MADMTGRIVMVTGATSGIGEVTALELARLGAQVIVVGRDEAKAQTTVAMIQHETNNPHVEYMIADLARMDSVRGLAKLFKSKHDQLHVLVNNAGMIFTARNITPDGYEQTFALNHLNYFLLTNLLLDTLKASGTPERKARIVNVSSSAHNLGKLDFDNLNGEKSYSAMGAYGVSKLCNILFTYELARRLQADGANVTANVLHPGVVRTGFGKNNSGVVGTLTRIGTSILQAFGLSAEDGAQTQIHLASSPEVEGVSGQYFEKKKAVKSNAFSYKEAVQKQLWSVSAEMTGIAEAETV